MDGRSVLTKYGLVGRHGDPVYVVFVPNLGVHLTPKSAKKVNIFFLHASMGGVQLDEGACSPTAPWATQPKLDSYQDIASIYKLEYSGEQLKAFIGEALVIPICGFIMPRFGCIASVLGFAFPIC